MFFVYVIYSDKEKIKYIGHTENLDLRLTQHNQGTLGRFTKNKGPWRLVYQEKHESRASAMAREKYLKTGAGRDFLKRETGF
jgi:putative endonuclease